MIPNQSDIFEARTRIEMQALPDMAPPSRPKTDGLDRRNNGRVPTNLEIGLSSDHCFYTGFTENISSGGLFFATRDILPLGSTFDVTFTLPNYAQTITVRCEVRWQRLEQLDNIDSMPGMGVRFLDISPTERDAVNEFIRMRDTLFYDDED